jgi:hypothetical protein
MSETVCPFCTFSPIDDEAERCPRCNRLFVDRFVEQSTISRTVVGGLTGAVTANPWPVALGLLVTAALWAVRGSGLLLEVGDGPFSFAVAAVHVLAVTLVLTATGPAKHAAALASVLAIAWAAWCALFGDVPPVVTVACLMAAAGLMGGSLAEPSRTRIAAGATFAIISALGGAVALGLASAPASTPSLVLVDGAAQWSMTIPPRWVVRRPIDPPSALTRPEDTATSVHFALTKKPDDITVLVRVTHDEARPLVEACTDAQAAFGLPTTLALVAGGEGHSLEGRMPTGGGAARLSCWKRDERFMAIAATSRDPLPDNLKAAVAELTRGLKF